MQRSGGLPLQNSVEGGHFIKTRHVSPGRASDWTGNELFDDLLDDLYINNFGIMHL